MSCSKAFRSRSALAAVAVGCALAAGSVSAQTAFGSATTIVFPLTSSTATFTSTITLYNPNPADVTASINYFDGLNTLAPGQKTCSDVVVPANGSVEFDLASTCTLGAGGHFGQLIVVDLAGTNQIFGYSRVQNAVNAGFSVEGFPVDNFANDTTSSTGLKGSTNPSPTYQTNCFVASQSDPFSYELRLFDAANAQIGSTVTGSLNAFEEFRYLDVFGVNGVNAPAATDFSNVRAEFTRTSAGTQVMMGFCTVQDNATFSADFRIAKAVTPPPPPPPPPPPGSIVLAASFNASIQSLLAGTGVYEFVGSTSLALAAPTTVSVYAGGWFAKSSGGPGSVDLAICYQDQAGPGPITVFGPVSNFTTTGAQTFHSATATGSLPAATYTIGLCAHNVSANSVNKNGTSSGYVFTSP
jgi:hypothetical protein